MTIYVTNLVVPW